MLSIILSKRKSFINNSGRILEVLGESWKFWENPGSSGRILEVLGESWNSSIFLGDYEEDEFCFILIYTYYI